MYSISGAVIFQDSDYKHWFLRYVKPGFRHCFIAFQHEDEWLVIDPVDSCIKAGIVDKLEEYAEQSAKILHFSIEIDPKLYRGGLCWFTCVEVVKAYMGIKSFWTFTPWQLYKLLRRDSDG
jgi:hypothetical protein